MNGLHQPLGSVYPALLPTHVPQHHLDLLDFAWTIQGPATYQIPYSHITASKGRWKLTQPGDSYLQRHDQPRPHKHSLRPQKAQISII